MSLRRIRKGELLVLVGLVGLIVSLFLKWFGLGLPDNRIVEYTSTSGGAGGGADVLSVLGLGAGWGPLGHPWLEFLAIAGLAWVAVLVLALRSGPGHPTYGAVVSIVLAIPLTALVLLLTLIRALLATPSIFDAGASGSYFGNMDALDTSPAIGTWIGLLSLLVALVGLWVAMADDRTSAAESVVEPPPASPVPAPRPVATDEAPPAA